MPKHQRLVLTIVVFGASLVPAATAMAGMNLGNHNETLLSTPEPARRSRHRAEVERLDRLGAERRRAGDLSAADAAYRRALVLAETHLAAGDPTTARVRNNLAVVLKYSGGFDEAAALYERSLESLTATLGPNHPRSRQYFTTSGALRTPRDDRPPARAAREAVSIREAALGRAHPESAADRAALAAILDATGRHDEAAELLEGALTIFEQALGPDHYEVGVTLGNLGAIDARRGDLGQADSRPTPRAHDQTTVARPDHVELVPTLGTLGVVCRRAGKEAEARQCYERALRLLEGRVAADHPQVATLKANVAKLATHTQ